MGKFTSDAIKRSYLKLLNQRPVNRITVKDITDDCGVNRNTFYYHFADLPTLLEQTVTEQAEEIIERYPTIETMEKAFDVAMEFAIQNKKAAYHIYNSPNRDLFDRYIMKMCRYVVSRYLDTVFEQNSVCETDKELIIQLYTSECFGMVYHWLITGMKGDIKADFLRICELRQGMIEETVSRCAAGEKR